jgi:iron(III) transport system substrate-binding protein
MNRRMPHQSRWRSPRALLILVAVALVALACGGTTSSGSQSSSAAVSPAWQKVIDAAKQEGTVVVYTNPAQLTDPAAVKAFEDKYGITVKLVRDSSGAIIARVDQERATGTVGADVAFHTEVGWWRLRATAGDLVAPTGPAVKDWPKTSGATSSQPFIVPTTQVYELGVNTNLVKTGDITTWKDVLKPQFKGKVGIQDYLSTGVGGQYEWLDTEIGPNGLQALRAQNPKNYASPNTRVQALASGEIAADIFGLRYAYAPLIQAGAPITLIDPPDTYGLPLGMGILKVAQHPNAAQLFEDFFMTQQGQTLLDGHKYFLSPTNAPDTFPKPTGQVKIFDPGEWPADKAAAYKQQWTALFSK